MRDHRVYLKVKIKSLAEEAKIIRKEEQRPHRDTDECGYSAERTGLREHRITVVRSAARHALLAYGFIRGRKYQNIEPEGSSEPNWEEVKRQVLKYGPRTGDRTKLENEFWVWAGKPEKCSVTARLKKWVTA